MSAVDDAASGPRLDDPQNLKLLEVAVPRLREASDLAGLMRLRGDALAVADAEAFERGLRKRAQRVAKRADEAIEELRRSGAETDEERAAREARELREARWQIRETEARLSELMVRSLQLLLNNGSRSPDAVNAFRSLAALDDDGDLRVVLADVFESRSALLVNGFDRSRRIFAEVGTEALLDERQEIERLLKSSAVELMTDGADVRGLAANAVPSSRIRSFCGNLPVSSDAASSATLEKINNLLLGLADEA